MKQYTYFPGCAMASTGKPIQASIDAVCKVLDIELKELEDWTCCGCPGESINELSATAIATRNLALAEKFQLDMVTACSCCYRNLLAAHVTYTEDPRIREQVKKALAATDLEYKGTLRVRNLVDIFVNDIGLDVIASKVQRKLNGMKVANYYGCHQTRPYGPDDFEFPVWQDQVTEALGAETVFFPLKAQCCGGTQLFSNKEMIYKLLYKILDNVEEHGGKCISSTLCPLCFTNLDANQGRIKNRDGKKFDMPVLALTQLMGIAFGLSPKDVGLNKNISPALKAVRPYLKSTAQEVLK
ncbi:MAG: CoB--CoM heterodisulfide reductase iron-sulfur subunit B family protein [Dehalococcoidales bacterium]|nr:CoB--CoM heterodisulfide reductase iron-sulfur subunit B family protein [Dehalococcoidales bacterium]